ncbi:hypothetical protein EW145_g4652 [Phellinidium pouzarii]|uniref:NAD(P)-binding protein n=1 Tax=Phellinidium pouzarii TaxID=167371 RepID=A0A4S4L4K8_9AGAM|nr:hypothetical protein EW145_g4652 [Phellinidium pouzarii]
MARNISDEALYEYADKVKGQTILITGAARGIGKEAALQFATRGANIVIGDIDVQGAQETVEEIKRAGGDAVCNTCNVLVYDDLVSLFELALSKFGRVDVVVPNAGISEFSRFLDVRLNERGLPKKPPLKTVEINLISVLHTTQLAFYYLTQNKNEGSLKALVFIGSMSSIMAIPSAPLYSASKHAIVGLMRSLTHEFYVNGLRVSAVCPWFADTGIIPAAFKVIMAGLPLASVQRIGGAIVRASTDSSPDVNGSVYTVPDEKEVFRIPYTEITEGAYGLLSKRVKRALGFLQSVRTFIALAKIFAGSSTAKIARRSCSRIWDVQNCALSRLRLNAQ